MSCGGGSCWSFCDRFQGNVEAEGSVPQQVLRCDGPGLSWKKVPKRTHAHGEAAASAQPVKDRLTSLPWDASGDLVSQPLLVSPSENPRVFKKTNVLKHQVNAMRRAIGETWVTRQFCIEWNHTAFAPRVKTSLRENQLRLRTLLPGGAPAHPPARRPAEGHSLVGQVLPPRTAPLTQPWASSSSNLGNSAQRHCFRGVSR